MTFTPINSFSEIVDKYDGFILDQYGVMHNGSESLPGSAECVEQLASMGKKLIILSNTSSPSTTALNKLPDLGFDPDNFVGAVTSGEEAARFIKETYGSNEKDVKKAIWFSWAKPDVPKAFLAKCGHVEGTTNVEEADFVITHGSDVLRSKDGKGNVSLGEFMSEGDFSVIDPVLEKCIARKLPMVCANPDLICKLPGDVTACMPGKISEKYEAMGGECISFGKPNAQHFKACLRELGLEADRVCHVGDSLHHDIQGANDANISSVFITGGVHSDDFDCSIGEIPERNALEDFFDENGVKPTHVSPLLQYY